MHQKYHSTKNIVFLTYDINRGQMRRVHPRSEIRHLSSIRIQYFLSRIVSWVNACDTHTHTYYTCVKALYVRDSVFCLLPFINFHVQNLHFASALPYPCLSLSACQKRKLFSPYSCICICRRRRKLHRKN